MSGQPANIEPDTCTSDDAGSIGTDFASIASTLPDYVYENGRRYHARYSDKCSLPNDEREQERLDLMHHVFRLTLNGDLCYSKLNNPQRILDVGTGTGIWAMEMAEEYPSARVIGTDLSPIQPGWTPDNVEFIIEDALQEWTLPESSFDFIHLRSLAGSVPDWPSLLRKCYKCLAPGGQIEVSEARTHFCCDDGTFPENCMTRYWADEFHRLSQRVGYQFDIFPQIEDWLKDVGFTNIETVEKVVPVGTWPKDKALKTRGRYLMALFIGSGLEAYSFPVFIRAGGWKPKDVTNLLAKVSEEILSNKMHIYTHCSYAIARKPSR
ncbi:hypothetical protein VTO42DRAFT_2657 [Malbranchea cinnamomea]